MDHLTWEDEVRLSDVLVRAKEVRARLAGEEPTTPEDIATLTEGMQATNELVLAHQDLVRSLARQVMHSTESAAVVDFEDLIQVGMMAMYSVSKSFDARNRKDGLSHDTGNRFSVYASMYITREMRREIKRGTARFTGSIAMTERTRQFLYHRHVLEQSLQRPPTDAEVVEASGISLDQIDLDLTKRSVPVGSLIPGEDEDEGLRFDVSESDRTSEVDDDLLSLKYIEGINKVLGEMLPEDESNALYMWLVEGRSTSDIADDLGIKMNAAATLINKATARLRHPQNAHRLRDIAVNALQDIGLRDRETVRS